MPVQRAPGSTSVIDVLDRVLDKGIVIDAWMRVSVMGIDLITVEARVVVLHHGRVLAEGTQAEIRKDPRVAEIYLGTDDA